MRLWRKYEWQPLGGGGVTIITPTSPWPAFGYKCNRHQPIAFRVVLLYDVGCGLFFLSQLFPSVGSFSFSCARISKIKIHHGLERCVCHSVWVCVRYMSPEAVERTGPANPPPGRSRPILSCTKLHPRFLSTTAATLCKKAGVFMRLGNPWTFSDRWGDETGWDGIGWDGTEWLTHLFLAREEHRATEKTSNPYQNRIAQQQRIIHGSTAAEQQQYKAGNAAPHPAYSHLEEGAISCPAAPGTASLGGGGGIPGPLGPPSPGTPICAAIPSPLASPIFGTPVAGFGAAAAPSWCLLVPVLPLENAPGPTPLTWLELRLLLATIAVLVAALPPL